MSFAEIADRRLLSSVASHLAELTWDVEPDGYQRLKVPPTADIASMLKLLARRGLDPAITAQLLDRFATRPLERALVAYDIAAGSLLGTADRALAERVRTDVAALAPVGATAAAAIPRDRVGALIEAAAGEPAMPAGAGPSLASAATVAADDAAGITAALDFARELAIAHLPSLALAFAQILWTRHAVPAAMDCLLETALDFERFDSVPEILDTAEGERVREAYFVARVALARLDTATAASVLGRVTAPDPRVRVAAIERALLDDQDVSWSDITALEAAASLEAWRYGSRVRDAMKIQVAPADAPIVTEQFITTFGDDMRMWAAAAYRDVERPALLALASREIRYGSHDPEAWRALAALVEDGSEIEIELQARAAAQLAAALG